MSIYKKYCLTELEFQILASSAGISRMYGFVPGEITRLDSRQLYEQLFFMMKKGFLRAEENEYVPSQNMEKLFYTIKEAEYVISVLSADNTLPASCIYLAEEAAWVEAGGMQGKYLKCSLGRTRDIVESLVEELELPQMIEDNILYGRTIGEIDAKEEKEWKQELLAGWNTGAKFSLETMKKYGLKTLVEKRSLKDIALKEAISLWEKPVCDMLVRQDEDSVQMFGYSKRRLEELLTDMVGGDKNDFG